VNNSILVVGGAGYIGSHMVLALREAGYTVTVFDNLSRGFADAVSREMLVVGDMRSRDDLKSCFESRCFDAVMHFGGLAYVGESMLEPELYYQNNIIGSLNLLSEMRCRGVNKIIFSSSCATYGEPIFIPVTEDHPQTPINPYGNSKLQIERVLVDYALSYGMKSISFRYFNAAGCDPKMRTGERHDPETHLIPLALSEALRTRVGFASRETRLTVFGDDFDTPDGSCIRDYIHVSDVCFAHLLALQLLLKGEAQGAKFFNLSNGSGFSVLDVINVCREVTGEPIEYLIKPRRPGDPARLVGNAHRARVELGWIPAFKRLDQIVLTAWNWLLRDL
jgi:UDP-glucose 4-epimerase